MGGQVDIDALGELLRLARGGGGSRAPRAKERQRHVVVRAYSGVFFGLLVARRGTEVDLVDLRHIYAWTSKGLPRKAVTVEDVATIGVGSDSRVSGVCSAATVFDVKVIADATAEARKAIEAVPCPA
jgi:hypothetical protein